MAGKVDQNPPIRCFNEAQGYLLLRLKRKWDTPAIRLYTTPKPFWRIGIKLFEFGHANEFFVY
ncbi:hypothetical protein FRC09_019110 [Ceratobasidium sp. 395]|nr:hypothetical protein FRC09_019110 [Ceratobasidium sp. 395]